MWGSLVAVCVKENKSKIDTWYLLIFLVLSFKESGVLLPYLVVNIFPHAFNKVPVFKQ